FAARAELHESLSNGYLTFLIMFAAPEDPQLRALAERLVSSLVVKPGRFLVNDSGELCSYQELTIEDLPKFAQAANDLISGFLKFLDTNRPAPKDGESEMLLRDVIKAAAKGHEWIKISKGQIVVECPCPQDDAEKEIERARTEAKVGSDAKSAGAAGTPVT